MWGRLLPELMNWLNSCIVVPASVAAVVIIVLIDSSHVEERDDSDPNPQLGGGIGGSGVLVVVVMVVERGSGSHHEDVAEVAHHPHLRREAVVDLASRGGRRGPHSAPAASGPGSGGRGIESEREVLICGSDAGGGGRGYPVCECAGIRRESPCGSHNC